jgi:AbrB family looped-hinge helix DNA binding protein
MSTKGQVVIPKQVREEICLKPGDEFLVTAADNAILLTRINRQELRRRLDSILDENRTPEIGEEQVLEESRRIRHGEED